ncbi:MAG: energy-coupling factor ABC transporter permease [Propionibacteriales bacterium]|nr:energy-coupling factor ABC transporter permease [Propionibacteriales bacterium]
MHVPDGFIDAPTSAATAAVAVVAVAVALRKAGNELDERTAPMAGLVAAFVFATQMLNFPVGAGTSGHLLGGALAAVLVGPWTAILCMSVVLLTQSLLFADGGITALGTNISLMGLVTVVVGWAVFRVVLKIAPRSMRSVAVAAFLAALVSVPSAALAFVGVYEIGGTAEIPMSSLMTAMVGWHVLIGIGEAIITGLTVSSVLSVRPDLVYGARGLLDKRRLEIRTASPATGSRSELTT